MKTEEYDHKDDERKELLLFSLQREDTLINNRILWALTLQGLLFAAVAFSLDKHPSVTGFINILAVLGISISVIGLRLSYMANMQIRKIREQWAGLTEVLDDVSPFGSTGHDLTKKTNIWGYSMALPVFTGLAWVAIIGLINREQICKYVSELIS